MAKSRQKKYSAETMARSRQKNGGVEGKSRTAPYTYTTSHFFSRKLKDKKAVGHPTTKQPTA